MSISLTLINRSEGEYKIGDVVSVLIDVLNNYYTKSEQENYISKYGESCLSILYQGKKIESKNSGFIVQEINKNHNLVLVKKKFELTKSNDFLNILEKVSSPIIVVEVTRMISELEFRPPWILPKGELIFPVGMITPYFKKMSDSPYKNDNRGLKFAKAHQKKDQSEIATAYYHKFISEGKIRDLSNTDKTGLIHFTTIVTPVNDRLEFSFIQNRLKIANYFFEPDILFSSNEIVARSVRRALYLNKDIQMRRNLRFYEIII